MCPQDSSAYIHSTDSNNESLDLVKSTALEKHLLDGNGVSEMWHLSLVMATLEGGGLQLLSALIHLNILGTKRLGCEGS